MDKAPGPGDFKISEKWLMEWVEFGWSGPKGIIETLTNYARLDAWCVEHERKEPRAVQDS